MSNGVKYEFGCLMAMVNTESAKKIGEINKKLISDDILYFEEGQEYGRENEPHITIKYGLTTNYPPKKIGEMVSHIKPFTVILESIDVFSNPKFDVVKINVKSNVLEKLNRMLSKLPNEDKYPIYRPHLTLAYVKPNTGKPLVKKTDPIEITINRIKYSDPIGKHYYDL